MLIMFLIEQTKEYYRLKKINQPDKNIYPTWLYHRFYEPKLVNSKEEHESIGNSWQKTPFEEFEKQNSKTEEPQASEDQVSEARGK